MNEIGGYFQLDEFVDNEYYKDMIRLNTGRNALLYLIKTKKIEKLFIPYYLCDSISNLLDKQNIEFEYYKIRENFFPKFGKKLSNNEYIYIVNYYGQLSNKKIKNIQLKFNNIIVDNTQSFFQKPLEGIYTIYSCRKYFGVPDGAYLSSNEGDKLNIEVDKSKARMGHILGRFEEKASDYYFDFKSNDRSLANTDLKFMSNLTKNILMAIDYNKVRRIRNENFEYLHDKLKKINQLKLLKPEGAFSYPLKVKNASAIREKLIKEKIYIPLLWPNVLKMSEIESVAYRYSNNILPLPCDQRYNVKNMEKIHKEILKCIN